MSSPFVVLPCQKRRHQTGSSPQRPQPCHRQTGRLGTGGLGIGQIVWGHAQSHRPVRISWVIPFGRGGKQRLWQHCGPIGPGAGGQIEGPLIRRRRPIALTLAEDVKAKEAGRLCGHADAAIVIAVQPALHHIRVHHRKDCVDLS